MVKKGIAVPHLFLMREQQIRWLFEHGDYASAADGSAIRCGRAWRTPEAFSWQLLGAREQVIRPPSGQ
jgi:hypothetical protein